MKTDTNTHTYVAISKLVNSVFSAAKEYKIGIQKFLDQ